MELLHARVGVVGLLHLGFAVCQGVAGLRGIHLGDDLSFGDVLAFLGMDVEQGAACGLSFCGVHDERVMAIRAVENVLFFMFSFVVFGDFGAM